MTRLSLTFAAGDDVPVALARAKVETQELVQGQLRVNAKNPSEAFVSVEGYARDIAIVGLQRRRKALEGDVVAVALLQGSVASIQLRGLVVCVLEAKHRRTHIGHLRGSQTAQGQEHVEFVPHDARFPSFLVRADDCPQELLEELGGGTAGDMLLSASITGWPQGSAAPHARLLDVLGQAGDVAAETNALLLEHGIDASPFPQQVLDDLPTGKFESIIQDQLPCRRDFRGENVYTIDPATGACGLCGLRQRAVGDGDS